MLCSVGCGCGFKSSPTAHNSLALDPLRKNAVTAPFLRFLPMIPFQPKTVRKSERNNRADKYCNRHSHRSVSTCASSPYPEISRKALRKQLLRKSPLNDSFANKPSYIDVFNDLRHGTAS
ncbi:phage tail protein [Anopheles sinensis]|uniref:Phage tail protein n=1 Tax=Anopheles sinensis TaxID=74873 RepID=A0A084VSA7_ANOSI|nr:phage tail protein [Anopheles sinensis]